VIGLETGAIDLKGAYLVNDATTFGPEDSTSVPTDEAGAQGNEIRGVDGTHCHAHHHLPWPSCGYGL
jgi:hypothetical protein